MTEDITDETTELDKYTDIWRDLSKAYKIIYKGLDKAFQGHNSNVIEYRIVWMIYKSGRQAMASLAEMSYVTQAWITGMVDRLEDKGLVTRIRSIEDRRVVNVELTNSGKKILQEDESY